MNKRSVHLAACSMILFFSLLACSLSPASAPSATPASTPVPAENTNVPTVSVPKAAPATSTPAAAEPTASALASASGGCTNAYFPVISGASWSYSSQGGTLGAYTFTRTTTPVSDKSFTINSQSSKGGSSSIAWNCQDGNLTALDAGAESLLMATPKYKVTTTSVKAEGDTIPASLDAEKTWTYTVTATGSIEDTSTAKTVDGQIVAQFNCSTAGADTITVPAGKFDTLKAICIKNVVLSSIVNGKTSLVGTNKETITYWYAKGVGFIQSIATGGINNETIVLTQYKLK
jgi:hypothetical protein